MGQRAVLPPEKERAEAVTTAKTFSALLDTCHHGGNRAAHIMGRARRGRHSAPGEPGAHQDEEDDGDDDDDDDDDDWPALVETSLWRLRALADAPGASWWRVPEQVDLAKGVWPNGGGARGEQGSEEGLPAGVSEGGDRAETPACRGLRRLQKLWRERRVTRVSDPTPPQTAETASVLTDGPPPASDVRPRRRWGAAPCHRNRRPWQRR
jgi:hypothetical protein